MYPFLAILITTTAAMGEYLLIRNEWACFIMIVITIFLSYFSYSSGKKAVEKCVLGGAKAYDLWRDADEIAGPIVISILIDVMIFSLTMIMQFQGSIYWPGIIMALIAIPITLISSSFLSIKSQVY